MSDINELRNEMDAVTLEMINLLKTRTDIAKQIGKVKQSIGKGIADSLSELNLDVITTSSKDLDNSK